MHVAALEIELYLPGVQSLKEKRSRLRPLLARLHKQFNIACAETGLQDRHQHAIITCVTVSTAAPHTEKRLLRIPQWIERNRPDLDVVDEQLTHY